MKRTLMLTMLATALLGGQVFAAEPTGTDIEGYDKSVSSGSNYYGKYSETESVSGGNVTVKEEATGEVPNDAQVIGGRAEAGEASNNMVTMQGGTVRSIYGGNGSTGASNNTVTMQDGTVQTIYGGWGSTGASNNTVTMQGGSVSGTISGGNGGTAGDAINNTVVMTGGSAKTLYGGNSGNNYTASGNVVIVTGGSISSILSAGYAGVGTHNNKMHLVGNGASNVNIADAKGVIPTSGYTGDDAGISLNYVFGGYAINGTSTGNSIDIYGTGIKISGTLSRMQILTFNITDGQMTGQNTGAALSLTTTVTSQALNLDGVVLQIKDLDVKEWTPGKTITLVQSEQEIKGLESGKAVNITKDGKAVARGQLVLSNDDKTLSLNVQGSVPEPATGTLGVFALAALAARRRKK